MMSRKDHIDKRFVLIHRSGHKFYPFKKLFRLSGQFGFPAVPRGRRERNGDALYLQRLEDAIPLFFFEGYSLNVTTDTQPTCYGEKVCAYSFTGTAIVAYEISQDLAYLVKDSNIKGLEVV